MASHQSVPVEDIHKHAVLICKDPDHKKEEMKLFCVSCSTPICILCRDYGTHKGHETQLLTKAIAEIQSQLRSLCKEADKAAKAFESTSAELAKVIEETRMHSNTIYATLDEYEKSIINDVKKRIQILRGEVQKHTRDEENPLMKQRESLATAAVKARALSDETQHILDRHDSILPGSVGVLLEKFKQSQVEWTKLDTQVRTTIIFWKILEI